MVQPKVIPSLPTCKKSAQFVNFFLLLLSCDKQLLEILDIACTSMQKISSIYSFILEIRQIIESYDLEGHTHI